MSIVLWLGYFIRLNGMIEVLLGFQYGFPCRANCFFHFSPLIMTLRQETTIANLRSESSLENEPLHQLSASFAQNVSIV